MTAKICLFLFAFGSFPVFAELPMTALTPVERASVDARLRAFYGSTQGPESMNGVLPKFDAVF